MKKKKRLTRTFADQNGNKTGGKSIQAGGE
jgi:hypothetical protein